MSEADVIDGLEMPNTRASLVADFRRLGLRPGMIVLAHSSLSSLGWTAGGPVAVVQALTDVLTPSGTLVMPAFTGANSDPALWQHPPVPEPWWPIIREHTPAFDPAITPTRLMGRIVEVFRNWPGVQRSYHPSVSFAAWGRHAAAVIENHSLDYSLGEGSPLRRLYELDAWVMLLGVGYGNNTSFHLAEYSLPDSPTARQGAAVFENGERVWRVYEDIDYDDDDFPELGAAFEETNKIAIGRVGRAEARLFRQRAAVDFAQKWLSKWRRIP
ncbi:MAG: AAC(3) family N-acetyltransferase [Caldilineales bacterium]|nr:AAC(3) family N-acetyltransferase [Caldilineales bacterium]